VIRAAALLAAILVSACGSPPAAEGEARRSGDGCTFDCGDGQVRRDIDGLAYCECWEAERCQQMIVHAREAGGDCLAFPTPCDVPSWFESCDPFAR
jgi:hypothetical protein